MVDIGFRGNIADALGAEGLKRAQVTVELIPSSGPATVITDRRSSDRPDEDRSGTGGRFDVVRNGNRIVVLVEEQPAPPATIEVTTSGPGGELPLKARLGGLGSVGAFDFFSGALGEIYADRDETEGEYQRNLRRQRDVNELLDEADEKLDDLNDKIAKAERAHNRAETPKARRRAKEQLETLKELFESKRQSLTGLRRELVLLKRWESAMTGLPVKGSPQCSDEVDNADLEDTIVDYPIDPGCESLADNDEKDEPVPVNPCPAPGQFKGAISTINTPLTNTVGSFSLRKAGAGTLLLSQEVSGSSGGPMTVPGEVCGPGTNVTVEWDVYADGTALGFPDPPPGDQAVRVEVIAQNPFGSGNAGGQDGSMVLALGTASK